MKTEAQILREAIELAECQHYLDIGGPISDAEVIAAMRQILRTALKTPVNRCECGCTDVVCAECGDVLNEGE